jgi:hypothetical protein
LGFEAALPRKAEVFDQPSGEAKLGVGGSYDRSACSGVQSDGMVIRALSSVNSC